MSSINETQGCSQKICSLPSAPFSMIMVDLDGTGHPLPIIGGFDGRVYVVRGRRAVELAEVGGWSTGLAAGDLDGDGREEVLCASGDNPSHLYNIRADGEVIWKQEAEVCWMGAGVARSKSGLMVVGVDFRGGISVFSSDGELIRKITHFEKADGTSQRLVDMSALSVGDLDGDGVDEIVVGGYWGGLYAFRLDGSLLWLCDTTTPLVEEGEQNSGVSVAKHVTTNGRDYVIDLQRGGKFVRHIQIADLDGDGRPEVICGLFRSDLLVADCEGNKMWSKVINDDVVDHMIGYVHMDQRGCFKDSVAKSQPCSIVVDRPDGLGKWIVALQPREDLMETTPNFGAADIFVFDADGNELCRDISGAPWFRLAAHPVKSDTVCIATGISESALYEIQMADLIERGSGIKWTRVPQAVQNWTDLLTQLEDVPDLPSSDEVSDQKIQVVVLYDHCMYDHYFFSYEAVKYNILAMHREFNRPGIGPLEYVFRVNLQEVPHSRSDTHLGLFTREQYLDFLDHCEAHSIPTMVWFSHVTDVNATAETMIEVCKRGYKYLRGFVMVEGHLRHFKDEKLQVIHEVLAHFKQSGMKFYMNTTGGAWTTGLLDEEAGGIEMLKAYGDTVVPLVKMNNLNVPEMETGSVLALWKAGWIGQWSNASLDQWTWTNISRNNPYTPSSLMGTLDLAYLALGANPIVYYQSMIRVDRDEKGFIQRIERMIPQTVHMKVIEQLIARNIIEPVGKDQVHGMSPVLFSTFKSAHYDGLTSGPPLTRNFEMPQGILQNTYHFQRVHEDCASAIFYGSRASSAYAIAKTPCGVYGIMPKALGIPSVDGVKEVFETDLNVIYENGEPLSVEASADRVREAVVRHADAMPFVSEDAFVAAQQFGDKTYRVFVIDPGYEEQKGGVCHVQSHLSVRSIRDRISGQEIGFESNGFTVNIPAGLFCILDIEIV